MDTVSSKAKYNSFEKIETETKLKAWAFNDKVTFVLVSEAYLPKLTSELKRNQFLKQARDAKLFNDYDP